MRRILLATPLIAALAACSPSTPDTEQPATAPQDAPMADPQSDPTTSVEIAAATATLEPTAGNDVRGTLRFEVADNNIRVTGEITGLPAGTEHGFHVHETGDCSAPDATSAGGHFNPDSSEHGRVGGGEHHAGDSDNLTADEQGVARVDNTLEGATIGDGAPTDIVGKGVIVHADADDYTSQPTGDAGDRLACGVIQAAP